MRRAARLDCVDKSTTTCKRGGNVHRLIYDGVHGLLLWKWPLWLYRNRTGGNIGFTPAILEFPGKRIIPYVVFGGSVSGSVALSDTLRQHHRTVLRSVNEHIRLMSRVIFCGRK